MTCPTKRPGSNNWQFKRRIPKDVQAILAKMPKAQWPKNWHANQIIISLRTADPDRAKAKCPEVAAEVEKAIEALRNGPKPLTSKQIAALSGTAYKAFAEGLEEDPGLTARGWLQVAHENGLAQQGKFGLGSKLGIFPDEEARRDNSMEQRFGPMADKTLVRHGIVTDEASRWRLVEALARDMTQAATKLARNADGDYSPDAYLARFPALEASPQKPATSRSLTALLDAWYKSAPDRELIKRDAQRIKARFEKLITYLKHDDIDRVTKFDIVGWIDHRRAQGISVKTINDSDIASFSNVFNWGEERGWLTLVPTAKSKIRTKRKPPVVRERYFTPDEAVMILKHAAAVVGTDRERSKTTAAKRWVPWLLAYSGARVVEMIHVRKEDIRKDAVHGWVLRLTPDAGNMKKNVYCDIPIHEHLIGTGFIDFVQASSKGHLFCEIGADGTVDGSSSGIYSRIRTLIREVVADKAVQPNHGWRHTFKTYGQEAGISEYTLNALSNHASRTEGENYMKVTVKTRAEAMARFPRWPVA